MVSLTIWTILMSIGAFCLFCVPLLPKYCHRWCKGEIKCTFHRLRRPLAAVFCFFPVCASWSHFRLNTRITFCLSCAVPPVAAGWVHKTLVALLYWQLQIASWNSSSLLCKSMNERADKWQKLQFSSSLVNCIRDSFQSLFNFLEMLLADLPTESN